MKNIIEAIENKTIESYGFEAKRTIITFKATEILRKINSGAKKSIDNLPKKCYTNYRDKERIQNND